MMILLDALIIGLLVGFFLRRELQTTPKHWLRPLLFERCRMLPLLALMLTLFLLPPLVAQLWPQALWAEDRSLLITLQIFPLLLALLVIVVNCLPNRWYFKNKPRLRWYHRLPLLLIVIGLTAEAAVLLLNHGYMPIPADYPASVPDLALSLGISNGALFMKKLIDADTVLPWLGQVLRSDWLTTLRLSSFPYLSLGEIAIALGLTGFGISQSYGLEDLPEIKKTTRGGTNTMSRKPIFSRSDGVYLKKIDPFMRFFPYIMKGRNESAVYFKQQIDVTALKEYINKKNHEIAETDNDLGKSTIFHAVLTAMAKTAVERPQVNRFIIGRRVYQRNQLTVAFVIKSEFRDDANEEIAIMKFEQEENLQSISVKLAKEIRRIRDISREQNKKRAGAVNWFNYLMSIPRIILRGVVRFLGWLDYHGWLPKFVIEADPMHTSVFVSNLGSLKIDAPFHHLYEWGTTSIFMTLGVTQKIPMVMWDGTVQVRDVMNVAYTVDERITDGYYYAKTINRFKFFLEHPEELEKVSLPNRGRPGRPADKPAEEA